jgi:hypothetical protein
MELKGMKSFAQRVAMRSKNKSVSSVSAANGGELNSLGGKGKNKNT